MTGGVIDCLEVGINILDSGQINSVNTTFLPPNGVAHHSNQEAVSEERNASG